MIDLKVYDNFLSEKELDDVNNFIDNKGYVFGWKSNVNNDQYKHWNLSIAGSKSHKMEIPIGPQDFENRYFWDIWDKINQDKRYSLLRAYSNSYTYGTEGTFHTDSRNPRSKTHMIYINRTWDRQWAGETIFDVRGDVMYAVLPKPGRLIQFPGAVSHAARSVSKFCTVDRRVLVYKSLEN